VLLDKPIPSRKEAIRCLDCYYMYSPYCKYCELDGKCPKCAIDMEYHEDMKDWICPKCDMTFTHAFNIPKMKNVVEQL